MGPTMAQIAREAGVSLATVSRVMNGDRAVRDIVRTRVMAVAKERGYRKLRNTTTRAEVMAELAAVKAREFELAAEVLILREQVKNLTSEGEVAKLRREIDRLHRYCRSHGGAP